jgi:tetratricopeptide (TPR) repeat protein
MKNIDMKYFIYLCLAASILTSCKNNSRIVDKSFVDSLIGHYSLPAQVKDNETDMQFWKKRIDPKQPRQVNESKYASTLITRFHQFGDISDVKDAESIYRGINKTYNQTLASPFVALTSSAMLQHHFIQADTLLQKAKMIGVDGFTANTLSFDVNFELGRYADAVFYLNQLKRGKDYSYYFRRSKYDHLTGNIDSAISGMRKAAALAKQNNVLKSIALSNAGDLYIHSGDLEKAAGLYKECIRLNGVDFHSMMGLGWIILVHDKNDTLAERIFKFVRSKNKLPDPLFKLYQMAQGRGDKELEKKYAEQFISKATDTIYGKMYNKYVIEIYTGILHDPAKAETLAKNELNNRATPQTYAWYAYTLFENNKKDEAYKVFQQHVSGQPLEGLELYYVGKMMKGMGKGYNANEFFKAADKNKYDLSPDMEKDLAASLEE